MIETTFREKNNVGGLIYLQIAAVVWASVCTLYFYYYSFAYFRVPPTFIQVLLPLSVGVSVAVMARCIGSLYFGWAATAFLGAATAAMTNSKLYLWNTLPNYMRTNELKSDVEKNFYLLLIMFLVTGFGMLCTRIWPFQADRIKIAIYVVDFALIAGSVVLSEFTIPTLFNTSSHLSDVSASSHL
jgi:hypothetical protein